MKRILLSLIALFSISANAQQPHDWKLHEITDNKSIVGYIYHTSATGTESENAKTTKVNTGLRLICSAKDDNTQKVIGPLIAVFWNTMRGRIPQMVEITVDGKQISLGQQYRWEQDDQILHRPIAESRDLIQHLKTGRTIKFTWQGTDSVRRTTMFDLQSFNKDFSNFSRICKI